MGELPVESLLRQDVFGAARVRVEPLRIEQANAAFSRIVEGDLGEVNGQPWAQVLQNVAATRQPWTVRQVRLAPGAVRSYDVTAHALSDADGNCTFVLVLIHEAEAQGTHEWIGLVSHELRTPIGAMLTSASAALLREGLLPEVAKALQRIESSGQRARQLIADLLALSEARLLGRLPIRRRRCDFHLAALQAVEEVRAEYPGREVQFEPSGNGLGDWDPDRIAQIVINLTVNAVDHSSTLSKVRVKSQAYDGGIELSVQNDGAPISPDLLPWIFEPLRRGEKRHREGNLGLGLFLVRELVKAQGGAVHVESSATAGTLFTVKLPRVAG